MTESHETKHTQKRDPAANREGQKLSRGQQQVVCVEQQRRNGPALLEGCTRAAKPNFKPFIAASRICGEEWCMQMLGGSQPGLFRVRHKRFRVCAVGQAPQMREWVGCRPLLLCLNSQAREQAWASSGTKNGKRIQNKRIQRSLEGRVWEVSGDLLVADCAWEGMHSRAKATSVSMEWNPGILSWSGCASSSLDVKTFGQRFGPGLERLNRTLVCWLWQYHGRSSLKVFLFRL
jgi:hypothetical protein